MPATRFEKTCPKCGSHLMIREGENGDFLACPKFPWCRYTEPLPDSAWDEHNTLILERRQLKNQYCEKCNRKGLLPFIKNGKTIPHAFVNCECRLQIQEEEYDHYRDIRPEDFDYPMSDTFRELTFELYGSQVEQRSAFTEPEERITVEPTNRHVVHHHHHTYVPESPIKRDTYTIK